MRIAICDDDKGMLSRIRESVLLLCGEHKVDATVDVFEDCNELIDVHEKKPYQILFSDIQMPQMDGFELSRRVCNREPSAIIVFITDYEHLVFDSLQYSPTYFVRKDSFEQDMRSAFLQVRKVYENRYRELFIENLTSEGRQAMKLPLGELNYVMTQSRKLYFVTDKERYEARGSLSRWKDELAANGFVCCHSSYLVNASKVLTIERENVVLVNGESIPISRHRVQEVKLEMLKRGVLRI